MLPMSAAEGGGVILRLRRPTLPLSPRRRCGPPPPTGTPLSLSSACGESVLSCTPAAAHRDPNRLRRSATYNAGNTRKDTMTYGYTTIKTLNEPKYGFCEILARKAKSILEDDNASQQYEDRARSRLHMPDTQIGGQVANAMAAKSKLLLREMKTVKADLAFAKERCNQLEDENRLLRESREKGDNHEDEDLIRLQLETLLEEKGRPAHENSVYARENRFLREIVEDEVVLNAKLASSPHSPIPEGLRWQRSSTPP